MRNEMQLFQAHTGWHRLTSVFSPQASILRSILFLLLVWPGFAQTGWTAEVEVRASLSEATIYLGESVQLEVRIRGLRDLEPPDLNLAEFDVTREGGQSYNNSSITIINGRTTRIEDFGYVARYRLRPKTTGVLRIPAVAVAHQGKTYRSQPLTLVVKAPDAQDYLLVQVTTDKPSYVLGERIAVTLELSLRKLILNGQELDADPFFRDQPPHIRIPWFDSLGDWKTSDLETFVQPFLGQQRPGFHINDYIDQQSFFGRDRLTFTLPRTTTRRQRSTGTFNYFTYRLQKTFRPIRVGIQTIPTVLVKAKLPTAIDTRGRARRTEWFVASSEPLTVTVHPVPRTDQPASFSGGVGRFTLTAEANPTTLKVGDPLTVTLTVHGETDSLLETVRPLALQEQANLARDFKIHTDPPAVKTADHSKTFTYTLRPKHADVRAVPPIEMAFYDPETRRFDGVRSAAIPLRVEGATALEASDVVVIEDRTPKSRLGRELAEGLLANYTGPEVLIPQQARLRFTPLIGGLLVFPPVAYLLTLCGRWWVRQRRQYPERQRRKRAARVALVALQTLQQQQDADDASICEGVQRALTGYMRDKFGLAGAGLTVDDITHHLHSQGLDQALIDQTRTLFHLCDNARYASGMLAVTQRTGLIDNAAALIQRLEGRAQR